MGKIRNKIFEATKPSHGNDGLRIELLPSPPKLKVKSPLPETNIAPENRPSQKEVHLNQPLIFHRWPQNSSSHEGWSQFLRAEKDRTSDDSTICCKASGSNVRVCLLASPQHSDIRTNSWPECHQPSGVTALRNPVSVKFFAFKASGQAWKWPLWTRSHNVLVKISGVVRLPPSSGSGVLTLIGNAPFWLKGQISREIPRTHPAKLEDLLLYCTFCLASRCGVWCFPSWRFKPDEPVGSLGCRRIQTAWNYCLKSM